jgi:small subunit ribosomal protein S16
MLKIRLQRVGKKHEPVFRVVVCDSKNGVKSGNNLEILGAYDAREKNETKINGERASYWISKGAQVSGTVHNVLVDMGVIKGKKINVLPKKTAPKKEAPASPEATQDETPVVEEIKAPEEKIEEPKVEETAVEEVVETPVAEEIAPETPVEVAEPVSAESSDVAKETPAE